jgi:hypothetical protein
VIKLKKTTVISILSVTLLLLTLGMAYAGFFTDKAKYPGTTLNVGSADLKLLDDISQEAVGTNLVDEKPGPVFNNITPFWWEDYLVKLYNNATTDLSIISNANYETANDPAELRQIVYVEPFEWDDVNANGLVDEGEVGISYGRKTIVKWKTEGLDMGTLGMGEIKGLILRFSTDTVSPAKQGTSAIFDFEFNATGQ